MAVFHQIPTYVYVYHKFEYKMLDKRIQGETTSPWLVNVHTINQSIDVLDLPEPEHGEGAHTQDHQQGNYNKKNKEWRWSIKSRAI